MREFRLEREYSANKGWEYNIKGRPPEVTLRSGRKVYLYYKGELSELSDGLNRHINYYYGEHLERVKYPDGSGIKYEYDNNGLLRSATDRRGKIIFVNKYDEFGRLIEQRGQQTLKHYEYEDQNRRTLESGTRRAIHYWNRQKQVTRIDYDDGTNERYEYDGEKLIYKADRNGREYHYEYDGEKLIREELPDGLICIYEYDSRGLLIKVSDSAGREINNEYSSKGLLIKRRSKLNIKAWRRESWERDVEGRILKYDINGRVTKYAYDEKNPLPSLIETPCGYKYSYRYDEANRLLVIKNDLRERYISYNGMNEARNDVESPYEFDYNGKLTDVDERLEIYPKMSGNNKYDEGGRLVEIRALEKDKYRLFRFKYDDNDNCIERREWQDLQNETSATGRVNVRRYEYDEQRRLVKYIDEHKIETKYKYDSENNCVKVRRYE